MPGTSGAMREISGNEGSTERHRHIESGGNSTITQTASYTIKEDSETATDSTQEQHDLNAAYPVGNTSFTDQLISIMSEFPTSQPAVTLTMLCQAYIDIDKALSQAISGYPPHAQQTGTSQYDRNTIFYLTSNESPDHWKQGFRGVTQRYLDGDITSESFRASLEDIMAAVEKLGEIQEQVQQNLETELAKGRMHITVPSSFWKSLDDRAGLLEDASREMERTLGPVIWGSEVKPPHAEEPK